MAWPPGTIATDKANATNQVDDHAPHHNALATAINDLVAFGPINTVAVPDDITATGTPSATTFLRGDGSWSTPAGGSGSVATDAIFDAKGDLAVGTGADTATRLAAGANGLVLTADSAEASGLKWAAGGAQSQQLSTLLSSPVAQYGFPQGAYDGAVSFALTANQLTFTHFFVPSTINVTQLAIIVATAAAGGTTARLGLCNWNRTTMTPGTLIVDAGTVAVSALGTVVASFSSVQLVRGWYATMHVSAAAPSLANARLVGIRQSVPVTNQSNTWRPVHRYFVNSHGAGAFTDPLPTNGTAAYDTTTPPFAVMLHYTEV